MACRTAHTGRAAVHGDSAGPTDGRRPRLDGSGKRDRFRRVRPAIDDKAQAVLDLCSADATCSAKLGSDPISAGHQAVNALYSGACNPWPQDDMGLGSFLGGGVLPPAKSPYFERMLLPASIYRILRCNSADLAWFGKVHTHMVNYPWGYYANYSFSDATGYNVEFSEFWPATPARRT